MLNSKQIIEITTICRAALNNYNYNYHYRNRRLYPPLLSGKVIFPKYSFDNQLTYIFNS